MDQTNSKKVTHIVLEIVKWIGASIFFLIAIASLTERAFISSSLFLVGMLLLLPILAHFWKINFPFLSNRLVKGGVLFALFMFGFILNPNVGKKSANKGQKIVGNKVLSDDISNQKDKTKSDKNYTYKVLSTESSYIPYKNATLSNYYIEITTKDLSKSNLQKAVSEIKTELCQGDWNLLVYDEAKYYYMDKEMEKESIDVEPTNKSDYKAKQDEIEKRYYLEVADHFVASLSNCDGIVDSISYYPYQDFHYKELGGKNFKKVNREN